MKIGIDIRELYEGPMTDVGRYVRNVVKYLAIRPSGHEYYLYSRQDLSLRVRGKAFRLRALGRLSRLWFEHVALGRAANDDKVDVFFSPYVQAPLNVHCPIVNLVYDLACIKLEEYELRGSYIARHIFKKYGRRTCRQAKTIITVSQYCKRDIVQLWGIAPEKIQVVPNMVGDAFAPNAEAEDLIVSKRRHGIDAPYIFYEGTCTRRKNVPQLIRAYAGLPELLRQRYLLVLAGRQDRYKRELQGLAESLGVLDRVKFVGFVRGPDLRLLHRGASLFVFLSVYEGFGMTPLEAMACGTPVVCSRVVSLPEVIRDAGVLVNPNDLPSISLAIRKVLENPNFADEMARKALIRSRMFRPDQVMPHFIEALENAAK